jgi:hypothetical protein
VANRAVTLLFKVPVESFKHLYPQIPYSPRAALERNLEEKAIPALDWVASGRPSTCYIPLDLPMVGGHNVEVFIEENTIISRRVERKAFKYYRRALVSTVALIYAFSALCLLWLFLFPPRGLYALLNLAEPWEPSKHYLDVGSAKGWAIQTIMEKR